MHTCPNCYSNVVPSLMPSQAHANVQTLSGDNAQVSWARKCNPAKTMAISNVGYLLSADPFIWS